MQYLAYKFARAFGKVDGTFGSLCIYVGTFSFVPKMDERKWKDGGSPKETT